MDHPYVQLAQPFSQIVDHVIQLHVKVAFLHIFYQQPQINVFHAQPLAQLVHPRGYAQPV